MSFDTRSWAVALRCANKQTDILRRHLLFLYWGSLNMVVSVRNGECEVTNLNLDHQSTFSEAVFRPISHCITFLSA